MAMKVDVSTAMFDEDGDGVISEQEMMKGALKLKSSQENELFLKSQNEMLTKFVKFISGLLLLSVVATVVSMFLVVDFSKDTSVDGDAMTNRDTGAVLQVDSSEYMVDANGVMVARTDDGSSRRLAKAYRVLKEDADGNHISDVTMQALATRRALTQRTMSSTMPTSAFKELEWLEVTAPSGAALSLRIQTIATVPHAKAKCGQLLKLVTMSGTLFLDDTDYHYDAKLQTAFEASGFSLIKEEAEENALNLAGHRRLSAEFSIVGFFNAIQDVEWECSTVEKPELPSFFSASSTVLFKCSDKYSCDVTVDAEQTFHPAYGVLEQDVIGKDGKESYYPTFRKMYVDPTYTAFVDKMPLNGDRESITYLQPGKEKLWFWQRDITDGSISHCHEKTGEGANIKLSLPDDFIFYYQQEVNGMRHFRISYPSANPMYAELEDKPFEHFDYFDNKETHEPVALVSPDEHMIQWNGMKTGEEREKFVGSAYEISEDDFENCLLITQIYDENKFPQTQEKVFAFNLTEWYNATNLTEARQRMFSPHKQQEMLTAYNQWEYGYPLPVPSSPEMFKRRDLNYLESVDEEVIGSGFSTWIEALANITAENDEAKNERRQRKLSNFNAALTGTTLSTEDGSLELLHTNMTEDMRRLATGAYFYITSSIRGNPEVNFGFGSSVAGMDLTWETKGNKKLLDIAVYGCYLGIICLSGVVFYDDFEDGGSQGGYISFTVSIRQTLPNFLADMLGNFLELEMGRLYYTKSNEIFEKRKNGPQFRLYRKKTNTFGGYICAYVPPFLPLAVRAVVGVERRLDEYHATKLQNWPNYKWYKNYDDTSVYFSVEVFEYWYAMFATWKTYWKKDLLSDIEYTKYSSTRSNSDYYSNYDSMQANSW